MAAVAPRRITLPYAPRPLQERLHADTHRFKVLVAHRRFGKTTFCLNELIRGAANCNLPEPRFAYIAPQLNQAKDITWSTLKFLTAPIPGLTKHEGDLWVELPGGRRVRIYGADNPDRLRGGYFDGVVVDEYAYMNPRVWGDVIRPMLSDRQGWAIFIGTPLGRNGLADLYDAATLGFPSEDGGRVKDADWAGYKFRASETGIVKQSELEAAARVMTADQYAQEYECSFDAAIPGAYYAALISQLEQAGHIKPFQHEPSLPVHTGWDLGIGDPTAIWFAQVINAEIRIIDYYENSGVGLEHYVAQLRAGHRSDWVYGVHFFPHDLAVKELGSGMSRVDVLKNFGLAPTVLPASSVDDGISQARFLLRKTWFNSTRTADGVKALRQYRSEWDEKRQVLKPVPLHDWTSHGADAFRYLCIGLGKHLISHGPLGDPRMSEAARSAGGRPRFASGGGQKPWGWN